jgi:hypothetical protein
MNEPISYQANPETRGTAPVQFFEADDRAPPAGTKATPRPSDRPRELPPACAPTAAFQYFASQESLEAPGAKATPRPAGRERVVQDVPIPPMEMDKGGSG